MNKNFLRKSVLWILFFVTLVLSIAALFDAKLIDFDFLLKKKLVIDRMVKCFPFSSENSLKEWEEKILKGRVVYRIEKGDEISYVSANSQKTASALYYKIKLDISKNPVISWKWRVDKFPAKIGPEKISGKKEEDFAARVYVMFPAAFFTNSKVIEYIWSEKIPAGSFDRSGYSKNIMVMVLQQGKASDWSFEKRNIYNDYVEMFGEKPKLNVGAIAFMTDADSTKTDAIAVYDEITIGYE
ncbi:MAG: DUF3047 domain-containing protein [Candidatus Omnitrophota bacterium]